MHGCFQPLAGVLNTVMGVIEGDTGMLAGSHLCDITLKARGQYVEELQQLPCTAVLHDSLLPLVC